MATVPASGTILGKWIALPLIVLLSWLIFCLSACISYFGQGNFSTVCLFVLLGLIPLLVGRIAIVARRRWRAFLDDRLAEHAQWLESLSARRIGLWIALAAGSGLYLELVLIRYHGTCFAVFGFFKNLSLLSCFLGLGIGYAMGRQARVLTPLIVPLLALQLVAMHLLQLTDVATTLENPVSEQFAMGLTNVSGANHVVLVYAFLIWVFSFNAVCLIPLGQLASHLMGKAERLSAYGWNLAGSIVAVILFWGLSYLWMPPILWFAVAIAALLPFLRGVLASSAMIAVLTLGLIGTSLTPGSYSLYSPYQILTVLPPQVGGMMIQVNHFWYQSMLDLSAPSSEVAAHKAQWEEYYGLPYLFAKSPKDVLVVGAGSGNDVASALRHGAGHVDAVEIDPLILRLGEMLHPERPYASDRVTAHAQDARAFIRYSEKKFDLIVYGLLDSHTSLSAMAGVRLDSYIYTVQAFQQARARLKPGGVLCLSFVINGQQSELAEKLVVMLRQAFDGRQPRVLLAPNGNSTFVIGGSPGAVETALPADIADMSGYFTGSRLNVNPSTDDWPFFYMPRRTYPVSYLIMIGILMTVSAFFIRPVLGEQGGRALISWPCFFLGAGFMLLETKAVTELALYYGSTWVVVSIVILAILVMAFLANLAAMRWPELPRPISYALLVASLCLMVWFTTAAGSIQSQWVSLVAPTAILTLPLFFSGLIFSAELRASSSVAAALASNLIGAMLGGCLEYNSMYFGYRSLSVLAIIIYVCAMVFSVGIGRRSAKIDAVGG